MLNLLLGFSLKRITLAASSGSIRDIAVLIINTTTFMHKPVHGIIVVTVKPILSGQVVALLSIEHSAILLTCIK